jgi:hypothetical protein
VAKAAAVALRAAQNAGQIFFDIFSRASFFYQKNSRLQKINPNIKAAQKQKQNMKSFFGPFLGRGREMSHHAVWLNDLLSAKVGKS